MEEIITLLSSCKVSCEVTSSVQRSFLKTQPSPPAPHPHTIFTATNIPLEYTHLYIYSNTIKIFRLRALVI